VPVVEDPATRAAVGSACPYCRFTLKQDIPAIRCLACSSVHHSECWTENGGCAVVGCTEGPKRGAAPAAGPVVPAAPVVPVVPAAPRVQLDVGKALAIGLCLLALAVAGAGLAVALSGGGSGPSGDAAQQTVVVTEREPPATSEPAAPAPDDAETAGPASDSSLAPEPAELESVLVEYFAAVKQGDFDAAYGLLSPSYKRWKASNGGRAKWEESESLNRLYLRPGGLTVTVEEFDPATQIATIDVRGMTYREPGEGTCAYEGITWMRRADGRWLYDQGYMQRADRRREWRPRQQETLGFACGDGY